MVHVCARVQYIRILNNLVQKFFFLFEINIQSPVLSCQLNGLGVIIMRSDLLKLRPRWWSGPRWLNGTSGPPWRTCSSPLTEYPRYLCTEFLPASESDKGRWSREESLRKQGRELKVQSESVTQPA